MTTHEFDLSTVNSIEVEADDGEEAIDMLTHRVREKAHDGVIPATESKTFDVEAKATACKYRVEGRSKADAEDNLREYIKSQRDALKEKVLHGDEGHALLMDLNTSCEAIEEVEEEPNIGPGGVEVF